MRLETRKVMEAQYDPRYGWSAYERKGNDRLYLFGVRFPTRLRAWLGRLITTRSEALR